LAAAATKVLTRLAHSLRAMQPICKSSVGAAAAEGTKLRPDPDEVNRERKASHACRV
jgi:hypothetical protein